MKTITLTQGKTAVVDDEDFVNVSQYRWHASLFRNGKWYAMREVSRGVHVRMHRHILCVTDPDIEVDHRNGDGLDNQKHNLRIATSHQNQWNRGKQRNNQSGFKGVHWLKSKRCWRSRIWVNGKQIHLGSFHSADAAYAAYVEAGMRLHGEFFHG